MSAEYTHTPTQFNLNLKLLEQAGFDRFLVESLSNRMALDALSRIGNPDAEQSILLWGDHSCGLTHLLEATCLQAEQTQKMFQYIDISQVLTFNPTDVLDGLERMPLVCIDNIECIAMHAEWERAIFHLFNNLRDAGHTLVMASHDQPATLQCSLPDLRSRLLGCAAFEITPLSDEKKQELLIQKAKAKGLDMSLEVARFILLRAPRHIARLFEILDTLDEASMQQQRKLTVPFVKSVLGL